MNGADRLAGALLASVAIWLIFLYDGPGRVKLAGVWEILKPGGSGGWVGTNTDPSFAPVKGQLNSMRGTPGSQLLAQGQAP